MDAISQYAQEVRSREFPAPEHCYPISDVQYEKFLGFVSKNEMPAPGVVTHLTKRQMHTMSHSSFEHEKVSS